MTYQLGPGSRKKLEGVHPDLVRVVSLAIGLSTVDFSVIEGLRTAERQAELVRAGASQTLKSRHLTGHAVDLVPLVEGKIRWDWPLFHPLAVAMKEAARQLNIPLEWGGDGAKFPDGPHFQLPWKEYP